MTEKIPCTVGILTRNSAVTVGRALESVKDFAEIIIVDGGSTDATLDIAKTYGARVIAQDPAFLGADGRIKDFGGVRNQSLDAAKNDWIFALDADECVTPELVQEVARIVETNEPGAFQVPRLYEYEGKVITCSANYPSYQMRFFHRGAVRRYIKLIHERIEVAPGQTAGRLSAHMLVPLVYVFSDVCAKWGRYIEIECARQRPIALRRAIRLTYREFGVMVLFLGRIARTYLFCRGTHLPLKVELMKPLYQIMLIGGVLGSVGRR